MHRGQRQHHRRKALVTSRHTEHSAPCRQRTDQAAKDNCGIVAIRQTVEHAGRPLRATVARIAAKRRERHAAGLLDLAGRCLNEQSNFPMSRVITQRDRLAIGRSDASLCAEQQILRPEQIFRLPTHSRTLRQAKQIAARPIPQHLVGQRQLALRTCCVGVDVKDRSVAGFE